jgi:predicted ribosome quality control (RQC) complex YloA/Tae2 family protein
MYCDALTLAAVADELQQSVVGGRVQNVVLVSSQELGLEVYQNHQRHYLLLSADPAEGGRVQLSQLRVRRGVEVPSPLLLRLRKLVSGGRIVAVQLPYLERLLRLTIHSSEGICHLIAEIMGRYSNIVLVGEDDSILECARRVPAHLNRYRVVLPGYAYVEPPRQDKTDIESLTEGRLSQLLAQQAAGPLWKRLVPVVKGASPLWAREVVHRATGDCRAAEADTRTLLATSQELMSVVRTRQWKPCVAIEEGQIAAYAPYALTHFSDHRSCSSISEAMETYYRQQDARPQVGARRSSDSYAAARARVADLIAQSRDRVSRKREALQRALPSSPQLAELRARGEALLAYAHEIPPQQAEWRLPWGDPPLTLVITLDRSLSVADNAQHYFRQYEKAKNASAEVPALVAQVDQELAYLDQLSTDLLLSDNYPDITSVEAALAATGHLAKPKAIKQPAGGPRRFVSEDGLVIWVGRNSLQNEELTFGRAVSRDV